MNVKSHIVEREERLLRDYQKEVKLARDVVVALRAQLGKLAITYRDLGVPVAQEIRTRIEQEEVEALPPTLQQEQEREK